MDSNAFRLMVSYVADFPECFDFQTGAAGADAAYLLEMCTYTQEVLAVLPESEVKHQEKTRAKYEEQMRLSPNRRSLSFGSKDSLPPKGWMFGETQSKAHVAEVTSKKAFEKWHAASATRPALSAGDKVLEMAAGGAPGALAGILEGRHVFSFDSDPVLQEAVMAKVEAAKVDYAKAAASGSHRKRPQDEAV
eukprot:CAMPEP_0198230600 /NCGR_PEP_ID=MMETSP1445-20131203/114755_1 /TAXON_ID=36898 /ORGANISM="Pyramimonas sp., Strain CCMP2087" /LENGTH=191 /DNA_ID=CAMNT_0043911157 /DNA_START=472 /DNA_END=1045 /DNA_ORIENTATION=-